MRNGRWKMENVTRGTLTLQTRTLNSQLDYLNFHPICFAFLKSLTSYHLPYKQGERCDKNITNPNDSRDRNCKQSPDGQCSIEQETC